MCIRDSGYGYFSPAVVVALLTITMVQLSYVILPSADAGGHAIRIVCREEHFNEVRKLFSERAKLESLSKNDGTVTFKLVTELSADEIDDLIAQQVHNQHLITIELAETKD